MIITLTDKKYNSLIGKKFGRLEILSHKRGRPGQRLVYCKCDCGNLSEKDFSLVKIGKSLSCGCLRKELVAAKNIKHGFAKRGNQVPEYRIWKHIKERCLNAKCKSWKHYGGRGIKVSPLWLNDFQKFFHDVGPRPTDEHSIDRVNNDGNYEPGNVRWATSSQQMRNYRRNHRIQYNGENLIKTEWAERLGIRIDCLDYRLKNWPLSEALARKRRKYKE